MAVIAAWFVAAMLWGWGGSDWQVPTHNRVGEDAGGIYRVPMREVVVTDLITLTTHCDGDVTLPVAVRGAAHSMGGQTMAPFGIQYDMSHFNRVIAFDPAAMTIQVQAGMTWHELIEHVNPHGLSPAAMQSSAQFSIGGSVSVNAHGIAGDCDVAQTVLGLTIVLANCSVAHCVPGDALCNVAVGGYGAAGVIAHVELQLARNERLNMTRTVLPLDTFWTTYRPGVAGTCSQSGLRLARLDLNTLDAVALLVSPPDDGTDMVVSTLRPWNTTGRGVSAVLRHWLLGAVFDRADRLRSVRNMIESHATIYALGTTRNEALTVDLSPLTRGNDKTYILQEFFVPMHRAHEWLEWFIAYLRSTPDAYRILLNLTLRRVCDYCTTETRSCDAREPSAPWHERPHKRLNPYLSYHSGETAAFVLLFRANTTVEQPVLEALHVASAGCARRLGGTFYLPYLPHYHPCAAHASYPQLDYFCKQRLAFDPTRRFSNLLTSRLCSHKDCVF